MRWSRRSPPHLLTPGAWSARWPPVPGSPSTVRHMSTRVGTPTSVSPCFGEPGSASGSAQRLARLDARCADVQPLRRAVGGGGAYRLNVRVPTAPGPAVRVRDVVAEARAFAADVARGSHGRLLRRAVVPRASQDTEVSYGSVTWFRYSVVPVVLGHGRGDTSRSRQPVQRSECRGHTQTVSQICPWTCPRIRLLSVPPDNLGTGAIGNAPEVASADRPGPSRRRVDAALVPGRGRCPRRRARSARRAERLSRTGH